MKMNEDTLVQETTANYLRDALGWTSVFAYNQETLGAEGTLGRKDETEVVLTRHLGLALMKLNPGLPPEAYQAAIRDLTQHSAAQPLLLSNRDKHTLIRDGVLVTFRALDGSVKKQRVRVIDFQNPEDNEFLAVRELWVKGSLYRRRADVICFVNGLPVVFLELKNVHRELRRAYDENFSDYKDTIPHLFEHNALVILGNGLRARYGSLSSKYKHFREWKRLEEEEAASVEMQTLLKGLLNKHTLIDIIENFILFDESAGGLVKIVAQNQQVLGVNRAVAAVRDRKAREGKLGVFWHTQGAGKSYSIVFFTRKVHRTIGANFTFLVLTDREDLDRQIYGTFAGCAVVDNDREPCRVGSGAELRAFISEHNKAYVFTLIQKFNKEVKPGQAYSERDDVIVVTDEAHRTQYGELALNMRNALPNASYIGFTGTPLFKGDEITKRVFGDYVSRYDFQRAVEDGATVPLVYDARGEKLNIAVSDLNERIAAKLEEIEIEDIDVAQRLERELGRDYHVITAEPRLQRIAQDFVTHYSTNWESGKAMFVCIDKVTGVRMFDYIQPLWQTRITELEKALATVEDEQELVFKRRQIEWMKQTEMAVVVSEEQGEVTKFRNWGIDITPHRRRIKKGFLGSDGKRIDLEDAFKKEAHPFRVVIVCAMWLTGFDVPSLSTLYLDKPLKAHTLMQAIARANRVYEGKENGLIIDYCGILKSLRKALATFAGADGSSTGGEDGGREKDPVEPQENGIAQLQEALVLVRGFLSDLGYRLERITETTGFDRNAAIAEAKEAINVNDEGRKKFELMARQVFGKFKACLTLPEVNEYRADNAAVNIIYKSLQEDRDAADISDIIRQLHEVIAPAIAPRSDLPAGASKTYDISRIDFERLRKEFDKVKRKKSVTQDLRQAIEKKLAAMLAKNPLRANFQERFEEIVAEYNAEKDRVTIETTFEALMRLVQDLDEEEMRAVREGLDEDTLALFDLLKKESLDKQEIDRLKKVATGLYDLIEAKRKEMQDWRVKEGTRDAIRQSIHDFLFADATGLPESYTADEIGIKSHVVFEHVYRMYA